MNHSSHLNMYRLILADKKKQSTILCSLCSYEKYETLFMRKLWAENDFGKIKKCDSCGQTHVLEGKQIL